MPDTAIDELRKAAKGLTYTSESDASVHVFSWKDGGGPLTAERLLELSEADPASKVDEVTPDEFFSSQDEEGYGSLRRVIEDQLTDVKAFRVGETNVRYYVVGKTKRGDLAGVWAKAVET